VSNYQLPRFKFISYYFIYIYKPSIIISFLNRPRQLNFKFLRTRKY
jgi:hypothetical protein